MVGILARAAVGEMEGAAGDIKNKRGERGGFAVAADADGIVGVIG